MTTAPVKSLAEIAEFVQYGYTASASEHPVGPRFLRITDIVPSQIDWDSVPYCEIDEKVRSKFSLASGDIVIARTGATVGYAKLIRDNHESVFASYLVRIRVDSQLADPGYVGRIVESDVYKQFVMSRVGGAAQPNANAKVLSSFRLPIPNRSTQSRIVEILSAYDDLIENNRRRIQLLEQAARLLYKEWFVHLRFPGHEHTPIIDGVPDGWEKKNLEEIATILKGKNITKDTIEEGNVPVVAGGLNPAYYHNTANAVGPVITVSASGANAGYVALYHQDIWASDCSYLSSSDNPEIWFLYLAMKSRQTEITAMQQGAAQPHVYPKYLKRLVLLYPPRGLRILFHETAEANFQQIENLEKQIERLAKARDLLLPKLMNGEAAV
jgi:type I restriction enzyme S subunit